MEKHISDDRLSAACDGLTQALGESLSHICTWLQLVAQAELNADVRGKLGASDLVQQTLLEAQRDFRQFRGKTKAELAGWLRRNLLHNVEDAVGRYYHAGKRDVKREVALESDASAVRPRLCTIASKDPSPSSIVSARERDEQLDRALLRLPAHYREALLLRYHQDLPFAAIGERMGLSAEAARKVWSRALKALQRELERIDGFR